jgi:RsiW-degrading membrane proteinase PrsW (M82 family)
VDNIWAFILLATAPGIFWMWYFYQRDKYEPEPLSMILKIFLLGMLITIPVAIFEETVSFFVPEVVLIVVMAPVIEELGKYFVVRTYACPSIEFSEPMDGIVYATAAALGFATVENIGYVLTSLAESVTLAISTGVFRALLSVPAHAIFAGMWGYALGCAKFCPQERKKHIILLGLALAIFLHASFNFLVLNYVGLALLILIVVPAMWWLINERIQRALGISHQ